MNIIKQDEHPDFGDVIIATTYSQRVMIMCSMIVFIVIILFTSLTKYTQKINVSGIVFPDKGIVSIKSRQYGILSSIYKKNGDRVIQGDALLAIDASSSTHFFSNNREKYLQVISKLKKINNKESQSKINMLRAKIQSVEREITQTRNSIENTKNKIQLLDKIIKVQEASFHKINNAYNKKYVSEIERNNMEFDLLEKKMQQQSFYNELSTMEGKIISLNDELDDSTDKIKDIQSDNEKDNTQLLMQEYGISTETESVFHAPVSGFVAEFAKRTGNYVNAGETILTIVPQGSINNIIAFVSPAFIGEIKKGKGVTLKYDSYPYQKFGVEHGIIIDISRLPLLPEDIYTTYGIKVEKQSFLITIKITKHQKAISITPGMSLEIEVPTQTASILQWIFPFFRNKNAII